MTIINFIYGIITNKKIVDDYDLPILYMTSREFDRQEEAKLIELKKRIQHLNTLLYNKVVQ